MSKKLFEKCLFLGTSFLLYQSTAIAGEKLPSDTENAQISQRTEDKGTRRTQLAATSPEDKLNLIQTQLDEITNYLQTEKAAAEGVLLADSSDRKSKKGATGPSAEELNSTFCRSNGGGGFTAEFLYWTTNYDFPPAFNIPAIGSTTLPTTQPTQNSNSIKVADIKVGRVPNKYRPGLRVKADFYPDYDDMDLILGWTYYHNNVRDQINSVTLNSSTFFIGSSNQYTQANLHYQFDYNLGDLELGKSYFSNSKVKLRPFVALRFGCLQERLHSSFTGILATPFQMGSVSGTEIDPSFSIVKLKQKFSGIGPRIGVDTSWFNYCGLSILGNISGSLLWGREKQHLDLLQNTAEQNDNTGVDLSTLAFAGADVYWQLVPQLQLLMGLQWERCITKDINFRLYGAWESNFWWQVSNIALFYVERSISVNGLTAGFAFDF